MLLCSNILDETNFRRVCITLQNVPTYSDNVSSCLSKSSVQQSRDKHTKFSHSFIRAHIQKEDKLMNLLRQIDQLADIFIRPLNDNHFYALRGN